MSARAREGAAVAAMVAATALWGGTFVAIRDSVKALPPQALVCGRFAVAAVLLALIALVQRRVPDRHTLGVGAVGGLLMVGGFFLQALGLRWTSAGSSAFLTCAGTLFAAFVAWPLLRQRPTGALLAGVVLALAGSALMSLDTSLHVGRGELVTLAGACVFALYIVWLARHAERLDPLLLTATQSATVAFVLWPFSGDLRAVYQPLGTQGWLQFLYLAIAGSMVAPFLQVTAQRTLPAGRISLLFALEPVFALVIALTLGGERFEPRWWVGAALILSAVVMVEWRAARAAS